MMTWTQSIKMLAAAGLLCAVVKAPLPAAPMAQTPIATEQVGGTILSVTPQIAYESAVLRVSGPDGYALTQRFAPGTPISADLLTEAEVAEDPTGQERVVLPDGRYRYEIVLTTASTGSQTHTGQFFVEGGAALGRRAKQAALGEIRKDLSARGADRTNAVDAGQTQTRLTRGR